MVLLLRDTPNKTSSSARKALLGTLFALTLALALMLTAILTDHWFDGRIVNSMGLDYLSGHVHAGLFFGLRSIDWGLGIRTVPFSVFDEICERDTFMGMGSWLGIVCLLALSIVWICLALISTLAATVADQKNALDPEKCGIHMWNILAVNSIIFSIIIYGWNYMENIRKNVLLSEQLESGFSTRGQTSLGYSFWMLCVSLTLLFLPGIFLCPCSKKSVKKEPKLPINGRKAFFAQITPRPPVLY